MASEQLLTIEHRDGVLHVTGELDAVSAPCLDAALTTVAPPVRIDLTAVTFIDSCGVHSLLQAHRAHCGDLEVVAASPTVRRLFQLSGVADILGPPALDHDAPGDPP